MDKQQLELSLANGRNYRTTTRRQKRQSRAGWWFERMRQVVDRAFDWETVQPRPQQICFPHAHREILLSPAQPKELQVCE
jgi:hypothetical protein